MNEHTVKSDPGLLSLQGMEFQTDKERKYERNSIHEENDDLLSHS